MHVRNLRANLKSAGEALRFAGGPQGVETRPLAALLGDSDVGVRRAALRTLRRVGKDDADRVHALAAGLADQDLKTRLESALGFTDLCRSREGDAALKAIFLEALDTGDPEARESALEGLAFNGPDDDSIAAIVRHLRDPEGNVRGSAALQILNVGHNQPQRAKQAVPALVEALADTVPGMRLRVAQALVKIAPEEPALHTCLRDFLQAGSHLVEAAAMLLEVKVDVEAALDILLEVLKRPQRMPRFPRGIQVSTDRNAAAHAIRAHAPPAPKVLVELRALLAEPDPILRIDIALALARLDPEDPAAVEVVAAAATSPEDLHRRAAVGGLWHVARWNEHVVPILVAALDDRSLRRAALMGLETRDKPPGAAVPGLVACLEEDHDDDDARRMALRLLGSAGPDALAAVPALLRLLEGANADLKPHALVALVRIGPVDAACASPLLDGLRSVDAHQRGWAILGLRKLGDKSPGFVSAVQAALTDEVACVRLQAAFALIDFGLTSAAVLKTLREIAAGDDAELREPAAEALRRLEAMV